MAGGRPQSHGDAISMENCLQQQEQLLQQQQQQQIIQQLKSKLQKQPPEVFVKNAVLKNFAVLTGKHLCCSLFLTKMWDFKKRIQHICFPMNIAKFLMKTFLENICERLLLKF